MDFEDELIFGNSTDRKSQTSGLRPMEELREAHTKANARARFLVVQLSVI